MNLEPVTKIDKTSKRQKQNFVKKIDDGFMSANSDVIVIFQSMTNFGAIPKPNSRHVVCKTYIFINSNLLSYKNL